jgi:hypothetical protein
VCCDLCQSAIRVPEVNGCGSLVAHAFADKKKWRVIQVHYCGLSVEFCPECAAGKTDEELLDMQMKIGEKGDK